MTDKVRKIERQNENINFNTSADALAYLKGYFKHPSQRAKAALETLEISLSQSQVKSYHETNIMDMIKKAFMQNDGLFLKRQLEYHITASPELPQISTDQNTLSMILKNVIAYLAAATPRGGRLYVKIEGYPLRGQPGIKATFSVIDENLKKIDESKILAEAFLSSNTSELASCRRSIASLGGQLWMEVPTEKKRQLSFVLPATGVELKPETKETYKYEIKFMNYPSVRKRFGKKKALYLLREIERYIKNLVRYPFDIVSASPEKGIIYVIYESPVGAGHSISTRISHRLGSEKFYIGKYLVTVDFRYNLSKLTGTT